MFGKMGQMGQMMKQVKALQEKMEQVQAEVNAHEIEGTSGAGLVKVTVNGELEIKAIDIDKSLASPEELDMLQDLIAAAFNDAKNRMDAYKEEKMKAVTGGLSLPAGMNLPF